MSSFGSPGGGPAYSKPTPPQRGSFPLDHDGECKHVMASYLSCMKKVSGVNDAACRDLAKSYLTCRMDRNLMARDDFKNLGFGNDSHETKRTGGQQSQDGEGTKGELRW
ncbi:cytochrome c oxidase assembly protein COX19 [Verticillium alfalfae VaMs.102]|uniref:Cytochrome c oxidase assembly protein COX19 n=1 Tax=Verticillium alfalfae (strain VaMs.102 / ATCC MYA-4576 / FGSC 10136) TaxID=526221 RepID=C9SLR6_VERA1|nr:cytochrome c oxidase assembly protein COX19 [Verticillium alfalfae VaMs.102]EEY19731.1 cytochrome c oxidase assembly protein COX19 [Verticillium alfalfae VaMs.102]